MIQTWIIESSPITSCWSILARAGGMMRPQRRIVTKSNHKASTTASKGILNLLQSILFERILTKNVRDLDYGKVFSDTKRCKFMRCWKYLKTNNSSIGGISQGSPFHEVRSTLRRFGLVKIALANFSHTFQVFCITSCLCKQNFSSYIVYFRTYTISNSIRFRPLSLLTESNVSVVVRKDLICYEGRR